MAERQVFISFDELVEVEITCLCGTGLVIPALSNAPELKNECPGCGRSLTVAAQAVAGFRQFYARAKEFFALPREDNNKTIPLTERSIRFRVSEE